MDDASDGSLLFEMVSHLGSWCSVVGVYVGLPS